MYPWSGAGTVAPLVLGGVLIIAFLLYEWKGRSDGILDHRIFRFGGRNFTLAAFGLFVEVCSSLSLMSYYIADIL